ncbi:MAG: MOSC domain-containing protein [Polyangiaceae bacterium]
MKSLRERVLDVPQVGRVSWIGVRPVHGAELTALGEVEAIEGHGLRGDVAAAGNLGGNRQVTLMQAEHLPVLAAWTQRAAVDPGSLRRNLLISGINLIALAKLEFRIGADVVIRGTGACAPCSKMDDTLGPGGFQAMRGHGGITAQVLRGGLIRLDDRVWVEPAR